MSGTCSRRLITLSSLLILFWTETLYAAVSAQLSAQDIDELETVRLILRASETRQTETLDLTALEKDFHVIGTNTSSQYRFVNGREQSWVDYQITLQPKSAGRLTIPSVVVGNDKTPTLSLIVRPLSAATRDLIDNLIFFENDLSAESIYVQSELILTRRLLYSNGVQLYSDLPGAPEVANAVVLILGETASSTTERDGRTYGLLEQRYAIFPESSGPLKIPGISVTASVRLVEQGRVSRKGVRVGTPDETITVKPIPQDFPDGEPWLPAEEVTLHQVLTPPTGYQVGDTLTHELLIHIRGNMGSAAPPIELDLPDEELRAYPQAPVINDDTNSTQVSGSRLQTASLLPLKPGTLAIPGRQVYWWDTVKDRLRISTTPPLSLSVGGTAVSPARDPIDSAAEQPANTLDSNPAEQPEPGIDPQLLFRIGMILAGIVVGSLAFFLTRRLLRRLPWIANFARRREIKRAEQALSTSISIREVMAQSDSNSLFKVLNQFLSSRLQTTAAQARQTFANLSATHGELLLRIQASAYGAEPFPLSSEERKTLEKLLRGLPEQKTGAAPPLPPLYAFENS